MNFLNKNTFTIAFPAGCFFITVCCMIVVVYIGRSGYPNELHTAWVAANFIFLVSFIEMLLSPVVVFGYERIT